MSVDILAIPSPAFTLSARQHGQSLRGREHYLTLGNGHEVNLTVTKQLCSLTVAATLTAVASTGVRQMLRSRTQRSSFRRRAAIIMCAGEDGTPADGEDPLLAEARAAAEAAKLQLEAAKLRAEAEELQKSAAETRLQARAQRLLGSTEAVGIGLMELMSRLKETESLDLTEPQAKRLAFACGQGQVSAEAEAKLRQAEAFNLPNVEELKQQAAPQPIFFRFQDLSSAAFDRELNLIAAEIRSAKAEAEQRERKVAEARARQEANDASAGSSQNVASSTQEEINDDRSTGTRILASLAYLLPLAEAFKFAIPLVTIFPPLGILFGPVAISAIVLNAVPFGSIICFIIFIFLAQWKEGVPRLTRFNLEQAVLLDISLIIPSILLGVSELAGGGGVVAWLGGFTFFLVCAVVAYCVSSTLQGQEPDGIPIISKTTKNVVDRQSFFD